MVQTATPTAGSRSSLSSMSTSSSSSLDLSKLDNDSTMNNNNPVSPRTPTRKHCQQDEERFFLVEQPDEGEHHYLESCFLCHKRIIWCREIFMYRGDEAFCSEKCRIQQMQMDESLETVVRRQRLRTKSYVSHKIGNYEVRNSPEEEKQQNKSIFTIQKRPTIASLTACGLISLQNSGLATNVTFMEP